MGAEFFWSDFRIFFEEVEQDKFQMNCGGGERSGLQAGAQLIEQASQQKRNGVEFFFRSIEIEFFFEMHAGFGKDEGTAGGPASELMQTNAFLSQTFGEIERRKRGQVAAGADAPTVERFQQFSGRQQDRHGKKREARGFFAGIQLR